MKTLIGLMGHSGVGKDTMADHLVRNYQFVKMSFADSLKRAARDILDIAPELLWGESSARNVLLDEGFTPREALQSLGDWGRDLYSDIWIKKTLRDAAVVLLGKATYTPQAGLVFLSKPISVRGVVIADVRYKNEMEAIRSFTDSALALRLRRKGFEGEIRGGIAGHSSEEGQKLIEDSYFDAVIQVQEGIPKFHQQIDELLKMLPVLLGREERSI